MHKKNDIALKESSLYVELIGDGSLICLLKKTRQQDAAIPQDARREFFLFPTENGVSASDFQPQWSDRFEDVDRHDSVGGMVKFAHYARVRAIARFTNVDTLGRFAEFFPYKQEVAARLFQEAPAGIDMSVLRVYKLRQPLMMVDRPMYDGTQSWVKLEAALSTRGCDPVMPRGDFELRVADIKARIEEVGGLEI